MKFGFIAKHRGIWPVSWICGAVGVSRSGFHAWLVRSPSARSRSDEKYAGKIRASFVSSYRTYGARRVWRDLLAEGLSCGLHRVEPLMRLHGLMTRPRRRGLTKDHGERSAIAAMFSIGSSALTRRTRSGWRTSLTSGPLGRRRPQVNDGCTRPRRSTCFPGAWSAGR